MKYRLLFIDTETTGNEEKDFLCQVAYKHGDTAVSALFKPEIPIPPEASAVHHITNKMVKDMPAFKFSKEYTELHEMAHDEKTIFIAHNAPFDLNMLKKEGIIPDMWIDTLRLARYLDTEEKISSFRLQYLRYLLGIEIEATAHDALGDVMVLEKLFERLVTKTKEVEKENDDDKVLERMMEISATPSLLKSFNFGKYKGQKIVDIVEKDFGYLEWMYKQKSETPDDNEDWLYTLKYYLGK